MISKHIQKTHTLQIDEYDCGVACLLSIIKFYNGIQPLEKLRELSGATKIGVSLLGLYEAAQKTGFSAEGYQTDMNTLKDHGEPLILHVDKFGISNHYVVCYYFDNQKGFLIGDPSKEVFYLTEEELDQIWTSKKCLTLSPNENFITTKEATKTQKKYFINLLKEDYKLLAFSVVIGVFVAGLGMAMSIFSQKLIDDILPSHKLNKLINRNYFACCFAFGTSGVYDFERVFLAATIQRF
jgi:ATP-binding cassette, subfamily C, bacteriocin exporter